MTMAMIDATMPTASDGHVPHASSATTDRPRSSVPSQVVDARAVGAA